MHSIQHHDLGTAAAGGAPVTLDIDGHSVTVPAGTSIMRAAALAGVAVPKLCATDALKAFGSCRLCLVEIAGQKGLPASCTTLVAPGMKVTTESPRLRGVRKGIVELYVSEHPLDCDTCPANRHCELQDAAADLGVTGSPYAASDQPPAHATTAHAATAPCASGHDASNPYFDFDPELCIVCSRCVRACNDIQGTFALTVEGRGLASRIVASQAQPFLESECVSCGQCVESCPTGALLEKSRATVGVAESATTTTCAYCGVGCSFDVEMRGEQVVRMVPNRNGGANHGHACVKGRFAYGYATHADRVRQPMIRAKITDPWREVSWDEALTHAAAEFRRIQARHGRDSIGGITSSRCTNEETFLVQKLVRAAFGNNNVDTCARVCHSPTGFGLKSTLGESAGTQNFDSVLQADVVLLIGANPTEGHPVFASTLKRRLREGARLIVIDPRAIPMVRTPHVEAAYHLQLRPGTNVAVLNALAHVVVTEGLERKDYVASRCEPEPYRQWREFVASAENSPEALESVTGVPAPSVRGGRAPLRPRAQRRDLLRPRRHRAQPGHDRRDGDRQPGDGHRQPRPRGRGREPAARPEQRAGLLRHGLLPARARRLSPHRPTRHCARCSAPTGRSSCGPRRACASRTCSRPRSTAASRACTCRARTSPSPTRTRSTSPRRSARWNASSYRTCS